MGGFIYGMEYYSSWMTYVLPAFLIALFAQMLISTRYNRYIRVPSGTNYTGAHVARMILDRHGLSNVRIERTRGTLTDHYDPRSKVIRLSGGIYSGNSVASLAVAAHEVGHAIQDAEDYMPLRFRTLIAPIANLGSHFVWVLIFLGFVSSTFFIELAIALFLGVVLFQIITLPVEFNASRRALAELQDGILSKNKVRGARKVLGAAAMTYVASTLVAIGELLRILAYTNRRQE